MSECFIRRESPSYTDRRKVAHAMWREKYTGPLVAFIIHSDCNLSFIVFVSLYASPVGLIILNRNMNTVMNIFQLQMKAFFGFNMK